MKERTNQHSCRSFLKKKKAFTLVELLVVIAIIGILFVVLISKVDFATDKAKAKGVQTDFRSYQLALKTVGMEQQGFSNDMDLLAEQLNKNLDPKLQVTVVDDKLTTDAEDPWGTQYTITYSEPENARGKIVITSAGADRTVGTDDDYNIVIEYAITSNGGSVNIEFVEGRLDGITPPAGDGEGGSGGEAPVVLAAGVYDAEGTLLADWATLTRPVAEGGYGLNASYAYSSTQYKTSAASGYNVLKNDLAAATKIVIPGSVQIIGSRAFAECSNLQEVEMQDGITTIGTSAFLKCTGLKSITIPATVTNIYTSAFQDSTNIENVYVQDIVSWCNINYNIANAFAGNPMSSADNLFVNGELLTNVVIPNTVTKIPSYAFSSSKITSISISSGVESIGSSAFRGTAITSIDIPDSVTEISDCCFQDCNQLQQINLSNYLKTIGNYVFKNCTSLSVLEIPPSVNKMGSDVVVGCTGLLGVYIDNLESWCAIQFAMNASPLRVAPYLYINDQVVTDIVIPDTVTTIPNYAFEGYKNLNSIDLSNVQTIGSSAFSGCSGLKQLEITNTLQSIGSYAFGNCSGLETVLINAENLSIETDVFNNCNKLKSVYAPSIKLWSTIQFSSASSNPVYKAGQLYINGSLLTNLIIPESIAKINPYAFYNCQSLESVAFDGVVTEIGDLAFGNCTNITTMSLPEGLVTIGKSAFINCNKMTSWIIPSSVVSIGNTAFAYNELANVTILATTPPTAGTNIFSVAALSKLSAIYTPAESADTYKEASGWSQYASKIQTIPTT